MKKDKVLGDFFDYWFLFFLSCVLYGIIIITLAVYFGGLDVSSFPFFISWSVATVAFVYLTPWFISTWLVYKAKKFKIEVNFKQERRRIEGYGKVLVYIGLVLCLIYAQYCKAYNLQMDAFTSVINQSLLAFIALERIIKEVRDLIKVKK